MPDYKETNLAGTAWQRCHEIVVANARGQLPSVSFYEERVIALEDGGEIRQALGALKVDFDPARVIVVLDPTTGQPTGASFTYGEAYALLFSAYLAAATERDAQLPPPAAPIEGQGV